MQKVFRLLGIHFQFLKENMAIREYERNKILFNILDNPNKTLSPQNLYPLECYLHHSRNFAKLPHGYVFTMWKYVRKNQ